MKKNQQQNLPDNSPQEAETSAPETGDQKSPIKKAPNSNNPISLYQPEAPSEASSNEEIPTQVPARFGQDGLERYIRLARSAPTLSAEEEWELARRLREENDLEAAKKLVFSNLRYVIAIAQTYQGYGLPLPDLVQEGNIGLMHAVKRFDPEKKVKLMTFARHWIRAEIHEFIIKNWRIVKMATTKAQRKLFFKLRSAKSRLNWMDAEEAEQIAKNLDVNVNEVYHMENRMSHTDTPFNATSNDEDAEQGQALAPEQVLADFRYSPELLAIESNEAEFQKKRMSEGLNQLDNRSREIIEQRWLSGNKTSLKELSVQYKISLERVRQIESRALKKLKAVIEA